MKYRYLSIIFLILVLSIGAVCAQDDADDIVAAGSDDLISVDNNADVLENELGTFCNLHCSYYITFYDIIIKNNNRIRWFDGFIEQN